MFSPTDLNDFSVYIYHLKFLELFLTKSKVLWCRIGKYSEQVVMNFSFSFQRETENRDLGKLPMYHLPKRKIGYRKKKFQEKNFFHSKKEIARSFDCCNNALIAIKIAIKRLPL